jgi:hypothetical protein
MPAMMLKWERLSLFQGPAANAKIVGGRFE